MARKLVCECGECDRCKKREYMRQRRVTHGDHVRELDRQRYYRDRDKRLAAMRAYQATEAGREAMRRAQRAFYERNAEKVLESKRAWAERNPEKRRAHNLVNRAVRAGRLQREACEVCGATDTHAHHDDYSKPLDVRWLCPLHHAAEHKQTEPAAA